MTRLRPINDQGPSGVGFAASSSATFCNFRQPLDSSRQVPGDLMAGAIFRPRFSTAHSSMITLSDEDSSQLVALSPGQSPTILDAYLDAENYFFEWTVWVGYAVYGLAFWQSGGWIALLGQAVILLSILTVTGIPPTEAQAQALRSKGDAYRRYQETTSAFVPLPRRKR